MGSKHYTFIFYEIDWSLQSTRGRFIQVLHCKYDEKVDLMTHLSCALETIDPYHDKLSLIILVDSHRIYRIELHYID